MTRTIRATAGAVACLLIPAGPLSPAGKALAQEVHVHIHAGPVVRARDLVVDQQSDAGGGKRTGGGRLNPSVVTSTPGARMRDRGTSDPGAYYQPSKFFILRKMLCSPYRGHGDLQHRRDQLRKEKE